MNARDVQEKTFAVTKWRQGYDMDEVDAVLERVSTTLAEHEQGRPAAVDAMTADEVVNARFAPTKFRQGYDQDQVDDFLDRVAVALRELAAR
ncbi:DivIVA domain-containing protein [Herbiconiux sp. VKM Ac-1786]|nr:DivIVA domain-containing protein [Herbiconiux sp. VKM Ac-1786]